jgi:hypothetical protein
LVGLFYVSSSGVRLGWVIFVNVGVGSFKIAIRILGCIGVCRGVWPRRGGEREGVGVSLLGSGPVEGLLETLDAFHKSISGGQSGLNISKCARCKERMRKLCGLRDGIHLSRLVLIMSCLKKL